jgi:hypothetical protein
MSMTLDEYRDQVKSDIKDYLTQEDLWPTAEPDTPEYEEQRDAAYDRCYMADSITGNASGSYTFNTWQAEENVCHLLWDEDLWLLLNGSMEVNPADMAKGPEYIDVSIRCALVSECLDAVLEEKQEEDEDDSDNE